MDALHNPLLPTSSRLHPHHKTSAPNKSRPQLYITYVNLQNATLTDVAFSGGSSTLIPAPSGLLKSRVFMPAPPRIAPQTAWLHPRLPVSPSPPGIRRAAASPPASPCRALDGVCTRKQRLLRCPASPSKSLGITPLLCYDKKSFHAWVVVDKPGSRRKSTNEF
jgi:hypothetical protein